MARIRSIKPEIRRSLTVGEWPMPVRLAWIYLWGYLDDDGRGLDDMRLIVAELFPLDRDVTERKMDGWLNLMATTKTIEDDVPPLCRYEVGGRKYLHAVNWKTHQKINRPQDSRLPPCPIHDSRSEPLSESRSERARSDSPPSRAPADQGAREQGAGNKGSGNARPNAADVNRAIRAYVESCPEPPAAALQARVERQARELLTEGHPPDRVITAAANAGRGGWTDLATQLQRDAATVSNAGQPGRATSKAQGWLTVDQDHPEQTAIGGQP